MVDTSTAGTCSFENYKLEYKILNLEFISGKSLSIEAVCYNPNNKHDREAIFKYSTNNINVYDKRLEIAFLIVRTLIKTLQLNEDNLRKLMVRNNKAYYISVI
jgi:hypothetical protein